VSTPDLALLSVDGRIATITLNRPEQRNALSHDLLLSLMERVREVRDAEGVSVCVITGAGRSFCAGMDLKAALDIPGAPGKMLRLIAEITHAIRNLPMVTIARINGAAIGGGCGLACVCDLGVTFPDAKLGYPEVDLGVCPAVVTPWLIKKIGAGQARRVLLEGGLMDGRRAHQLGLVTHLAESADALDATVNEVAGRIAKAGPMALHSTKRWLNQLDGSLDLDVLLEGARRSAEVVESEEAKANLRAMFARKG
jgi:methylglutaconyl-CoA hydratase